MFRRGFSLGCKYRKPLFVLTVTHSTPKGLSVFVSDLRFLCMLDFPNDSSFLAMNFPHFQVRPKKPVGNSWSLTSASYPGKKQPWTISSLLNLRWLVSWLSWVVPRDHEGSDVRSFYYVFAHLCAIFSVSVFNCRSFLIQLWFQHVEYVHVSPSHHQNPTGQHHVASWKTRCVERFDPARDVLRKTKKEPGTPDLHRFGVLFLASSTALKDTNGHGHMPKLEGVQVGLSLSNS